MLCCQEPIKPVKPVVTKCTVTYKRFMFPCLQPESLDPRPSLDGLLTVVQGSSAEAYIKLRAALEAAENASRSSCRTVWEIVAGAHMRD